MKGGAVEWELAFRMRLCFEKVSRQPGLVPKSVTLKDCDEICL